MAIDEMRNERWNDRQATVMSPRVNGCGIHLFLKISHTDTHTHTYAHQCVVAHRLFQRSIFEARMSQICVLKLEGSS